MGNGASLEPKRYDPDDREKGDYTPQNDEVDIEPKKLFFSYNWDYKKEVIKFYEYLDASTFYNIWIDRKDLTSEETMRKTIAASLPQVDLVVIFRGWEYQRSQMCRFEFRKAVELGKPIYSIDMSSDGKFNCFQRELWLTDFVDSEWSILDEMARKWDEHKSFIYFDPENTDLPHHKFIKLEQNIQKQLQFSHSATPEDKTTEMESHEKFWTSARQEDFDDSCFKKNYMPLPPTSLIYIDYEPRLASDLSEFKNLKHCLKALTREFNSTGGIYMQIGEPHQRKVREEFMRHDGKVMNDNEQVVDVFVALVTKDYKYEMLEIANEARLHILLVSFYDRHVDIRNRCLIESHTGNSFDRTVLVIKEDRLIDSPESGYDIRLSQLIRMLRKRGKRKPLPQRLFFIPNIITTDEEPVSGECLQNVADEILKIVSSDKTSDPLMIYGESGVGKTELAKILLRRYQNSLLTKCDIVVFISYENREYFDGSSDGWKYKIVKDRNTLFLERFTDWIVGKMENSLPIIRELAERYSSSKTNMFQEIIKHIKRKMLLIFDDVNVAHQLPILELFSSIGQGKVTVVMLADRHNFGDNTPLNLKIFHVKPCSDDALVQLLRRDKFKPQMQHIPNDKLLELMKCCQGLPFAAIETTSFFNECDQQTARGRADQLIKLLGGHKATTQVKLRMLTRMVRVFGDLEELVANEQGSLLQMFRSLMMFPPNFAIPLDDACLLWACSVGDAISYGRNLEQWSLARLQIHESDDDSTQTIGSCLLIHKLLHQSYVHYSYLKQFNPEIIQQLALLKSIDVNKLFGKEADIDDFEEQLHRQILTETIKNYPQRRGFLLNLLETGRCDLICLLFKAEVCDQKLNDYNFIEIQGRFDDEFPPPDNLFYASIVGEISFLEKLLKHPEEMLKIFLRLFHDAPAKVIFNEIFNKEGALEEMKKRLTFLQKITKPPKLNEASIKLRRLFLEFGAYGAENEATQRIEWMKCAVEDATAEKAKEFMTAAFSESWQAKKQIMLDSLFIDLFNWRDRNGLSIFQHLIRCGCGAFIDEIFQDTRCDGSLSLLSNEDLQGQNCYFDASWSNQTSLLPKLFERVDMKLNSKGELPTFRAAKFGFIQFLAQFRAEELLATDENGRNFLFGAAETGQAHVIQAIKEGHVFLQLSEDDVQRLLTERDRNGHTIMFTAIQNDQDNFVDRLVSWDIPGLDAGADDKGRTQLFHALMKKKWKIVDALRKEEPLGHQIDASGETPAHHFLEVGDDVAGIKGLLDRGWNYSQKVSPFKSSAAKEKLTFQAIRLSRLRCLEFLLTRDAQTIDRSNDGLLHEAVIKRKQHCVEVILKHCQALIWSTDNEGKTPIFYAIKNCDLEMLQLLLQKGASLSVEDKVGHTPITAAIMHGDENLIAFLEKETPDLFQKTISQLVKTDNSELLTMLLSKSNVVDINRLDENGTTPISLACGFGSLNAIKVLHEKGAIVAIKSKCGSNALHDVMLSQKFDNAAKAEIIKLLTTPKRNGDESLTTAVNETMIDGRYCLQLAIQIKCPDIIKRLLEVGASTDIFDDEGWGLAKALLDLPDSEPTTESIFGCFSNLPKLFKIKNISTGITLLKQAVFDGDDRLINRIFFCAETIEFGDDLLFHEAIKCAGNRGASYHILNVINALLNWLYHPKFINSEDADRKTPLQLAKYYERKKRHCDASYETRRSELCTENECTCVY